MLATQYPDVNFIIPHLGGFADDWMVHLQVIDQLTRFPNVYADTSGVRYFDAIVAAVRRAGPGKLIFGSDGPQLHPGVELHKIHVLGLPPRAEAMVTGDTLLRLLGPGAPASRARHVRRTGPSLVYRAGPGPSVSPRTGLRLGRRTGYSLIYSS
jgi:predicted TIM-barrel fold metal-dependent hydrolase